MKTVTSNRPAHGLLFPILLRRASALDGIIPQKNTENLRLEQMLAEQAWAAFHIWDRTQRGIFPKGTFEATGGGAPVRLAQNGGRRNLVAHCQTDRVPSRVRLGRQAVLTKNGEEAVGVNSMESPKT